MPTETLTGALSVTSKPGGILLARGVRAGHWVFIAGLLPDDLGDAERRVLERRRGRDRPNRSGRARPISCAPAAPMSRLVRCDWFFQDWRAVPFFHQAARRPRSLYRAEHVGPAARDADPGRHDDRHDRGRGRRTAIELIFPGWPRYPVDLGRSSCRWSRPATWCSWRAFWRRISRATWAASRRRPRCLTGICGRATASSSRRPI